MLVQVGGDLTPEARWRSLHLLFHLVHALQRVSFVVVLRHTTVMIVVFILTSMRLRGDRPSAILVIQNATVCCLLVLLEVHQSELIVLLLLFGVLASFSRSALFHDFALFIATLLVLKNLDRWNDLVIAAEGKTAAGVRRS